MSPAHLRQYADSVTKPVYSAYEPVKQVLKNKKKRTCKKKRKIEKYIFLRRKVRLFLLFDKYSLYKIRRNVQGLYKAFLELWRDRSLHVVFESNVGISMCHVERLWNRIRGGCYWLEFSKWVPIKCLSFERKGNGGWNENYEEWMVMIFFLRISVTISRRW